MFAYTHENLYEIGDVFVVNVGGHNSYRFTLVSYDEDNWVTVKYNDKEYSARREIQMVGDDCGFTGNLKIYKCDIFLGACVVAVPLYAAGLREVNPPKNFPRNFKVENGDNCHNFTLVAYEPYNWVTVKLNNDLYKAQMETIDLDGDDVIYTGNLDIMLGDEWVFAVGVC